MATAIETTTGYQASTNRRAAGGRKLPDRYRWTGGWPLEAVSNSNDYRIEVENCRRTIRG